MSSRCWTVQPSHEVPPSSGMWPSPGRRATARRRRRATRTPPTSPTSTPTSAGGSSRAHPVEVPLGHDLPAVQHEDPVGVRLVEERREVVRATPDLEAEPVEVALGARQRSTACRAPREMLAVGTSSRTCWNPQRLNGGSCQFARFTSSLGGERRHAGHQSELGGGLGGIAEPYTRARIYAGPHGRQPTPPHDREPRRHRDRHEQARHRAARRSRTACAGCRRSSCCSPRSARAARSTSRS